MSSHKKFYWTCMMFADKKISDGAINNGNSSLEVTPPHAPPPKKKIQHVLYLCSVCLGSRFIFFYLLSLFFLFLVPFPSFPFTSPQ